MKKKVLFVATVDKGHILKFHIPYLKYFKEKGFEVHVACAGDADIPYCDKKYELLFERSPYKTSNFRAYRDLKDIINKNQYNLIHCHTPVGGVIGRLAAKDARKKGTSVIYTAHGFHFFKGASLINWSLYYPIEKWLSRYTDCLITLNEEDYVNSTKYRFKAGTIKKIHGVGIDLTKFTKQTKETKKQLRKEYGYKDDDFILFYAAELNQNKHQDLLIDAVCALKTRVPNIKLLLAGVGNLGESYKEQVINYRLTENIHFLGHRNDIASLLGLSDIAVASSRREGLPVNVMEAMATGLSLVVTDIRGHSDLVIDGENGYVVEVNDVKEFSNSIERLYKSEELRIKLGEKSIKLVERYSIDSIIEDMGELYSSYFNWI